MLAPVPAYLDPTTGSIAYQVTISGLLALGAAVRIYWDRLKRLFRRLAPHAGSRRRPDY